MQVKVNLRYHNEQLVLKVYSQLGDQTFFGTQYIVKPILFWNPNFFCTQNFWTSHFHALKVLLTQKSFVTQNFFGPKIGWKTWNKSVL